MAPMRSSLFSEHLLPRRECIGDPSGRARETVVYGEPTCDLALNYEFLRVQEPQATLRFQLAIC